MSSSAESLFKHVKQESQPSLAVRGHAPQTALVPFLSFKIYKYLQAPPTNDLNTFAKSTFLLHQPRAISCS